MNKYKITRLLLFAVLIIFNSCKKETKIIVEHNPDTRYLGLWKVSSVSNPQLSDVKYIEFKSNKTSRSYYSSGFGFKSDYISSYSPYTGQLLADIWGGQTMIFNYHFNGDTLVMEYGILIIKSLKANSSEVDNWVNNISSSDQIIGLYSDLWHGIGFDGSNILVPDYNNSKINKINLATRLPNGDISVSGSYPYTVEYDGTDLWVSNNGDDRIYRYPMAGGSSLSSSPSLGPWVYGIAFDPAGNHLWANSNNADTLYQINKTNNQIISTRYIGYGFRDMAWSNGKLYMVKNNFIYRVNTTGFVIERSYRITSGEEIYGIAAAGSDFWLNINGNKLIKVALN